MAVGGDGNFTAGLYAAADGGIAMGGTSTTLHGVIAPNGANKSILLATYASGTYTERARLTTSGFYVGSTAAAVSGEALGVVSATVPFGAKTTGSATYPCAALYHTAVSGDNRFFEFYTDGGTLRGTVDFNRAATQIRYNITSDMRIKTDLGEMEEQGEKIDRIKLHKYMLKETNYITHGAFAQELYVDYPDAVTVPQDPDSLWGVDRSALVWPMLKEIQSLRKRVAKLEAARPSGNPNK